MIKYLISFIHEKGSGMIEICYSGEIEEFDDVIKIKKHIEEQDNLEKVVIMNIQRFPI